MSAQEAETVRLVRVTEMAYKGTTPMLRILLMKIAQEGRHSSCATIFLGMVLLGFCCPFSTYYL